MTRDQATRKAALVTLLFTVFCVSGIASFNPSAWRLFASRTALYALLLVHTFLSIRCFSQIIDPHDRQQQAVDLLLVVSYFALAQWQSGIPFLSAWVVLFAFATLKYALLVGRSSHTRLLRRKLVADIGGLGLGMFTMFSGSLPLMFAVFAAASVYYLVLNPLYVLDTV